jgi:hypothetical protein
LEEARRSFDENEFSPNRKSLSGPLDPTLQSLDICRHLFLGLRTDCERDQKLSNSVALKIDVDR